jgi:hypothetical protein
VIPRTREPMAPPATEARPIVMTRMGFMRVLLER